MSLAAALLAVASHAAAAAEAEEARARADAGAVETTAAVGGLPLREVSPETARNATCPRC